MNLISYKALAGTLNHGLNLALKEALFDQVQRTGQVQPDVTPDPIDFQTQSSYNRSTLMGFNTYAQVTGINAAATLHVSWALGSGTSGTGAMYYRVTSSVIYDGDFDSNPGLYSTIANGGTISITNNQYLGMIYIDNTSDFDELVTVRNQNSSGTVLGSFSAVVYSEPL